MGQRSKRTKSRGSTGHNRKSGEEFLLRNQKKAGIQILPSGLQYEILESGDGPSPAEDATIVVHQRCWLVNGTIIEDTYRENKPSEVAMPELIEGYREGITLMKKGGRSKFYIPPELAWGKKGTGNKIPPNAVLIFDVRLIDFW